MSRWGGGRGRGRVAGPITRRSGVARGRATAPPDRLACTSACRTPGTRRSRSWRWSIRCALSLTPCDGAAAGLGGGRGGEGVIREFVALAPMEASILAERRRHAPRGAAGGRDGARGSTCLNGAPLGPKVSVSLAPGDVLRLETPGGGGWGAGGKPERGDRG